MPEGLGSFSTGLVNLAKLTEMPRDQARKTLALNALATTYGDKALAPEQWGQAASAAANEAQATRSNTMLPYDVEAKKQTIAHNEIMNPLLEEQGRQTVKTNDQAIEENKIKLADMSSLQRQQGLETMQGLLSAAVQQGKDPEQAWNAMFGADSNGMSVAQQLTGVSSDQYQRYHDSFVNDPAGTLKQMHAAYASATLARMTPAQRVKMQGDLLGIEKTKAEIANKTADTAVKQQKLAAANTQAAHDKAAAQYAADSTRQTFQATRRSIAQAIKLNPKVGNLPALTSLPGAESVMPFFGGGAAVDFAHTLESIHSEIVTGVIQRFKQTSEKGQASGVGRILAGEIKLWQQAFAALDVHMSPAARARNLRILDQITVRLEEKAQKYFAEQGVTTDTSDPLAPGGGLNVNEAVQWLKNNPDDPRADTVRSIIQRAQSSGGR